MNLLLHDSDKHLEFAPLTLTRPVCELRAGILTNTERWKLLVPNVQIGYQTEPYLQGKFPHREGTAVNGSVVASMSIVNAIKEMKTDESIWYGDTWIAGPVDASNKVQLQDAPIVLNRRWELYQLNGDLIKNDFVLITDGRTSRQLSSTNTLIGDANMIFIEEGAKVEAAILNTTNGPIYIGKDAEIMEGSIVRGPFAMNEKSALKIGAKVYGPTTLGPHCKVGGEVNNVIFQAYSNKGHDGFLGNSLIGEWCNLGADTNCSNLKNNYGFVKTYNYRTKALEQTSEQFMGLVMGDHSKCGINTMFNTASVVGVSSNVFGAEFPPKHVPSFSWGVHGDSYDLIKAMESANNMMHRRGLTLSQEEIDIFRHLADKE